MYIPKKEMDINAFRAVFIPRNRDYFSRIGSVTAPASAFSGDEPVHQQQRKVEDIEYYARYAEAKARETETEE